MGNERFKMSKTSNETLTNILEDMEERISDFEERVEEIDSLAKEIVKNKTKQLRHKQPGNLRHHEKKPDL